MTPQPTGKPARVRLTYEQAKTYQTMLSSTRYDLVLTRAEVKAEGGSPTRYNRAIEEIDRMQEELARAASERGWQLS